jgi:ABC-type multidrug transport system fused ATPase/permease subunit
MFVVVVIVFVLVIMFVVVVIVFVLVIIAFVVVVIVFVLVIIAFVVVVIVRCKCRGCCQSGYGYAECIYHYGGYTHCQDLVSEVSDVTHVVSFIWDI